MEAIARPAVVGSAPAPAPAASPPAPAGQPGFAEALTFSTHAQRRLEQRGIEFTSADVDRLEQAMNKAEAKGSRDSLILMDDLALIVSIKNRVVVTAMDARRQKEGVFTNIDSVVIG